MRRSSNHPLRCSEPGCGEPIGRGFERVSRHPTDPSRQICFPCYWRIRRRSMGSFRCGECGRTVNISTGRCIHPQRPSIYVCGFCYNKLSGYFEKKTASCPICGENKPLVSRNPANSEQRVCNRCSNDLLAPRRIVRLSLAARSWPRPQRQLFDAALQRGSSLASDLRVLQGLAHVQPFLPLSIGLSAEVLSDLHRWVLEIQAIPVTPSHRGHAAAAISRALVELYGPPSANQRYRLLLNRRLPAQPIPAAELLCDFVEKELPTLRYAPSSIEGSFFALRRFFYWLAGHLPEVYFLRQIQPQHFQKYQLDQGLAASAIHHLRGAWLAFAPFAAARGHSITIQAIPWDDLKLPKRQAPVYPDPLTLFRSLDAFARDARHQPFDRMLAHLLALVAPSREEIGGAAIPVLTQDDVRVLRRSLVASRCVIFPDSSGSRRRMEDYRRLASSTPSIPLRSEPEYLELYAAVDTQRQATLHSTDCPLLFVTTRQRVFPEGPIARQTIANMLHRIFSRIGFPDLQLGLLRNSHALVVAREVSPRPAVIAAATGRSFQFATRILRSMDLDPRSGLEPLPEIPLLERHDKSVS